VDPLSTGKDHRYGELSGCEVHRRVVCAHMRSDAGQKKMVDLLMRAETSKIGNSSSKKVRPYNLSIAFPTIQVEGLDAYRHGKICSNSAMVSIAWQI